MDNPFTPPPVPAHVSRFRAVGSFAVLALVWGLSFPAISVGLDSIPPLLFAAFRYDVAAALLLAYAMSVGGWRLRLPRNYAAAVAGGVFLVGANGLLFVGQQTVPSGVAAIIQGLIPIVTTLWALLILPDERLSAVGTVGIGLGFVGVGLVVRPDPTNLLSTDVLGRTLVLGQVVGVALGGVLVQRARPDLDQTALAGWSMGIGAAILHAWSLGAGEPMSLPTTVRGAGAVLYLGVFSTALAFSIYFALIERYGALETSLVAYVVPVVATLAGVVLLHESVTVLSLAGFVVIFLGFVLLKRHALADLLAKRETGPA
jgi:drug/metabolite transporter (DMT)-like permease